MRRATLTTLLSALVALGGCENGFRTTPFARPSPTAATTGDDGEASYTILLTVFSDPATHVRDAETTKAELERQAKWSDVLAVHKAGHSELFWGKHKTTEAAEKELADAKAVFPKAIVMPLPGKDIGPPEWNLKNVKADYSLLLAVCKDDPSRNYHNRKQQALYTCRGLREQGVEAYFYHGTNASHVTIGLFGPRSVRVKRTAAGEEMEVLDPRIEQFRQRYPELLVNGNTESQILRDPRTGRIVRKVTRQTHLIRIPKDEPETPQPEPDRPGQPQPRQGPRVILRP